MNLFLVNLSLVLHFLSTDLIDCWQITVIFYLENFQLKNTIVDLSWSSWEHVVWCTGLKKHTTPALWFCEEEKLREKYFQGRWCSLEAQLKDVIHNQDESGIVEIYHEFLKIADRRCWLVDNSKNDHWLILVDVDA